MKVSLKVQTEQHVQFKEITTEIQQMVKDSGLVDGIVILSVPHTTAALTINENADPDVVTDIITGLNQLVPLNNNYRHFEGNSAAHIKSSLIGQSEQLLIEQGKLLLGTWQGIYFCEFDGPRSRSLHIKLIGTQDFADRT